MSWWKWGTIPARMFLKLDDGTDTGQFLFASSLDTRFPYGVYEISDDYTNDHLTDIPYRWTTPRLNMNLPWSVKRFRFVTLDVDDYNGGLTVAWEVDGGIRSGSFEANVPVDRESAYGEDDDVHCTYDATAVTEPNGGVYTEKKAYSLTFRLPQEARGKSIQFTMSCDVSGNVPAKILSLTVGFSELKQLYPAGVK